MRISEFGSINELVGDGAEHNQNQTKHILKEVVCGWRI